MPKEVLENHFLGGLTSTELVNVYPHSLVFRIYDRELIDYAD